MCFRPLDLLSFPNARLFHRYHLASTKTHAQNEIRLTEMFRRQLQEELNALPKIVKELVGAIEYFI